MTRVLMIVSNGVTHDPRVAAEASSLSAAGYDVTILGWDRDGTLAAEERRDGVRIVRVRNTLGMTLRRYDLFRLRPWWRLASRTARALHGSRPFDVVHCHDLDTLPAGVSLVEAVGPRDLALVYDAHEVFPYLVELSRARRWAPKFEAMERDLVRRADLVVVAGPGHRDYLAGMTDQPIHVVTNSKPLLYEAYEPPATARMTVVYLGGLVASRLLLPLAELAAEDPFFDLEVGGSGPLADGIEGLARASRGNVRFLGQVPMKEVVPRTRAADVVFCMFDPAEKLNRIGVPNKFFEALAAGRPVLASRGTWVASEVASVDCGLAVEYTKDALREALRSLAADPAGRERMGRNAFRLAREKYNWAREEATLLAAYRGLAARTAAKP